ncbi:protein of unknown function [Maridesulfovibrio hydrothermalis AM13 = DSM 14728]|uniref:Uncharacterized protein n=1 Tax=Maridesulfovibrio hydrothermalis AM13 = DSM 14728 TaxID=1121451 RepID=L0R8U0_9BACT|nr:protein of unknown function [Maridesulfovibrio hydrothermalis AM13 = DSM 14728]
MIIKIAGLPNDPKFFKELINSFEVQVTKQDQLIFDKDAVIE